MLVLAHPRREIDPPDRFLIRLGINEDKPLRVNPALMRLPAFALAGYVRSVLFIRQCPLTNGGQWLIQRGFF